MHGYNGESLKSASIGDGPCPTPSAGRLARTTSDIRGKMKRTVIAQALGDRLERQACGREQRLGGTQTQLHLVLLGRDAGPVRGPGTALWGEVSQAKLVIQALIAIGEVQPQQAE